MLTIWITRGGRLTYHYYETIKEYQNTGKFYAAMKKRSIEFEYEMLGEREPQDTDGHLVERWFYNSITNAPDQGLFRYNNLTDTWEKWLNKSPIILTERSLQETSALNTV